MPFTPAAKQQTKLCAALAGPSGSGKTYTALAIATAMSDKVAVLDSENGKSRLYAPPFAFDLMTLRDYDPRHYIQGIREAEQGGYGVLIIDSLSHAWFGRGGELEKHDKLAAKSGNSYTAWRDVSTLHNELVDALTHSSIHIIATLRTKTGYEQRYDQEKKRNVVEKIGLQTIFRDGIEYEFDVVGDLDLENRLSIGKTRCPELKGRDFLCAGKELADILLTWVNTGEPSSLTKEEIEGVFPGATLRELPLEEAGNLVRKAFAAANEQRATAEEEEKWRRGIAKAKSLGIDTSPYVLPAAPTRRDVVETCKALLLAIRNAEQSMLVASETQEQPE